jgi:YegS/Rv2252/BmrU family lipid kinase
MLAKKATIIYNPMSGRRGKREERAAEMVQLLQERGIQAEAKATAAPDDATRLTEEALAEGSNIIISYGGDGTLNEVIQAMVGSQASIGVWAGGTANVVARDLHLPRDPKALAEVIAAGKTTRIALGVASTVGGQWPMVRGQEAASGGNSNRPPTTDHRPLRRYFFMFAGIGLDASISRGVNRKLKRKTGEFAFWVSGLKHLLMWKRDPFTVEMAGKKYESAFTLVGKGKSYGGNLEMAKNARLEDPEFEVFILPRFKTNIAYLVSLIKCFFKKPEKTRAAIVKGDRVVMDSESEVWVELDGELVGALPMTFEVLPDALSVIVP